MPITPYLDGAGDFDAESRRVMGVAFEMARVAIQRDCGDYADAILAKRIIELAKTGERNPDLLCERALSAFRSQNPLAPLQASQVLLDRLLTYRRERA